MDLWRSTVRALSLKREIIPELVEMYLAVSASSIDYLE
jgi:hypothetical protein